MPSPRILIFIQNYPKCHSANFQVQMVALNQRKTISKSFIIAAFVSYYILCQWQYQVISQTINPLSTEQGVIDCNDYPEDCRCGSIAEPQGTSLYTRIIYPNGTTVIEEYDEDMPYDKNLKVYYRCVDEENILVGKNMRECSHGNWIGSVPRCAFNLRNNTKLKQVKIANYEINRLNSSETKNVTQSQTEKPLSFIPMYHDTDLELVPDGTFQIPLKNQPSDCLRWSLFRKQVWSITLNKPTRIHYVRIKLYGVQIEDLYLNREISFDMVLKNIIYKEGEKTKMNQSHIKLPLELKCNSSTPSYNGYSYQQKYSANYLVLEFLCEIANIQKSIFEYDGEVDQLYANVIEVQFFKIDELNEFRATPINTDKKENLKLKDKISKISLCELELYTFHRDCGIPDIPVSADLQRDFNFLDESERKTYKYICNDKNEELKGLFAKYKQEIKVLYILGNSFVECGNYARWKNQFPQCIRIVPCKLLNLITYDQNYELNVKYESTSFSKTGNQVIPSGKYARISCVDKRKQNKTEISISNKQSHNMSTQVTIDVICKNGKWMGLERVTELKLCKSFFKDEFKVDKENSTISTDNHQIVTLPVRIIQIMFGAFIVLVLIIISLCVCIIFRRSKNIKSKTLESKPNDDDDHDYAEINYDLPYYTSIKLYLELDDGRICENDLQVNEDKSENFQYETMTNDIVEDENLQVNELSNDNDAYTPMTSK